MAQLVEHHPTYRGFLLLCQLPSHPVSCHISGCPIKYSHERTRNTFTKSIWPIVRPTGITQDNQTWDWLLITVFNRHPRHTVCCFWHLVYQMMNFLHRWGRKCSGAADDLGAGLTWLGYIQSVNVGQPGYLIFSLGCSLKLHVMNNEWSNETWCQPDPLWISPLL